jgi:aldehyde oxidoreductase
VLSLPELLDILRPKYQAALIKAKADSTALVKRGVGIALGVYGSGLDGPDSAEVDTELNSDGTITICTTWHDHGQGADMGVLATAHEALRSLGIAPDKIRLVLNDTAVCPNGGPAGGSRSQVVVGQAIKAACDLLLAGMKKAAGYRTYAEMVTEKIPTKYRGKWTAPANACDGDGQGNPFACYMYGVFMAEVAVATETGVTAVEKMTLVADIGKIANRLVVDGQMYGGMAQGIGLALTEDFEDIKKHSTMVGAGFPYIKQIPDEMELVYVETTRPDGPFGASGVGELPLTCPHAAVINGIYNACGVRITRLPALPEKVLAGLKK